MVNEKVDDTISSTILQICKNSNRAGVDSIYQQVIKVVDFENIFIEFLDDRIHKRVTDRNVISKINSNAQFICE